MPKLVFFLFLGFCVMAVNMAPPDKDKEDPVKKAQDTVNKHGPQIEEKVRMTDPTFNWDSWWGYSKYVFTVINKMVPPNRENQIHLCKEDSDNETNSYINQFGSKIEEEVRNNDKYLNFHWDSWWNQAIPILKVIGEVVKPLAEQAKAYCEKDEELERTQALVNSYGPQIEMEVQKNDSTFNWDSWWRQNKPILTVTNKVFKSDPKHLENLCKSGDSEKASEEYLMTLGAEVEKRIQEFDPTFNYESWWIQSKPILTVIGKVVKPLAEKANALCNKDEVKAKPEAA